jgi:hypothetical protein
LEKERPTTVVQASKYFVEKDLQILHSVVTKTFQPEPGKTRKIIIPQKMGTLISFGESWLTGLLLWLRFVGLLHLLDCSEI